MKRDLTKIFLDEIYSKPPKRNYPTNKIEYNHIYEIWSIDLADMIDYKISNNKGFRYIFIIISKLVKNQMKKKSTSIFKTREENLTQNIN